MAGSELARSREQIEQEMHAMALAMNGFRVTGSHTVINHQYEAIGSRLKELETLIGEEESARVMTDIYNNALQ